MEFEYWWLLGFPLFFGLGWMAARIDIKQIVSESRALPRSYFKGLNFLLNEQPDKAIEAFIEVVKVDPETIELHFALGSLLRRRGEYDRAIRMHQNLLERADLGAEQKLSALAELGQDYLKAGILDRAEEVFRKLETSPQATAARRHLLQIYEQEKDWARAIDMTRLVESDPRALPQDPCEPAYFDAAGPRPHPLGRTPPMRGPDRLLEAQIIGAASPDRRRDLELVRNLVHGHTRRLARYRCENCGFKARQFHWHCPACGGWETYPPRRTEEFDLTP